jgi:glutamate synthase (NADPH/NADH) small chain
MTKEYLHNSANPEDYYLMPTIESINDEGTGFGYQKTEDSDLLDLIRPDMVMEDPSRKTSFIEIVKGYSLEQAKIEASRCVGCEVCTKTCPANMHIPQYIEAIWNNNLEEGLELLYKTNPLPGVCGSICTHTCETVCSIGVRGEPIAIRWLKRYIVDNAPEEMYEKVIMEPVSKVGEGKVAIIGGGAAGMSCAYYLRTLGYDIDLYEAKDKVGGVVRYGAPVYRLPEERLNKDVDLLEKIGVKFHINTKVGVDISLDEIKKGHDAVFLSTGFPISRSLNIPNIEHKDVELAMELLAGTRTYQRGIGEMPDIHESVVVIGGGNVAFDVARTIERLQQDKFGKSNVNMVSLETRDILPADLEEVEEGEEEGLHYYFGNGPVEVVLDGESLETSKIKGLKVKKCISVFDEEGRFSPSFDEEDIKIVEGTQIYVSIGQMNDHPYFTEEFTSKIEINRGKIKTAEDGQVQGVEWLFAGGDIVHGPDIIHGVADGHHAAVGIDRFLSSK